LICLYCVAEAPVRLSNPWADGIPASTSSTSPAPAATTSTPAKVSDAEFWLNSTASQIDPFAGVPHVGVKQASTRSRAVNITAADSVLSPRVVTTPVYQHSVTVASQYTASVHPQVMMSSLPQQRAAVSPQLIGPVGSQPIAAASPQLIMPAHPFAPQVAPVQSQQVAAVHPHLMGSTGSHQVALVNSQLMGTPVAAFSNPQPGVLHSNATGFSANVVSQPALFNTHTHAAVTAKLDGIQKQSQAAAPSQAFDPFESAWAAKSTSRGILSASSVTNPFQTSMEPAFQVKL
jgi:hypothetical protein